VPYVFEVLSTIVSIFFSHTEISLEMKFNLQRKNFFHVVSFLEYSKELVTVISHTVTEAE
jgi:hypothetical protein